MEPYGWWVSRNNMKMVSWGGAPADSRKCACGVTNSCTNNTKMCNCDADAGTVLEDSGSITDKRYLPIKELRFGYASFDRNRIALYSVGKLICRGTGANNIAKLLSLNYLYIHLDITINMACRLISVNVYISD